MTREPKARTVHEIASLIDAVRFGLSYRDLEELLAERGIDVDHVTL